MVDSLDAEISQLVKDPVDQRARAEDAPPTILQMPLDIQEFKMAALIPANPVPPRSWLRQIWSGASALRLSFGKSAIKTENPAFAKVDTDLSNLMPQALITQSYNEAAVPVSNIHQTSKSPMPLLVLGDGDVQYFRKAAENALFMPRYVKVLDVGDAIAAGMPGTGTKTNSSLPYQELLEEARDAFIVVLYFGGINCGDDIPHRADNHAASVEAQMQQSVDACFGFVDELIGHGFERIVVTGACLPTTTCSAQDVEIVDSCNEVVTTQWERTDLMLRCNDLIKSQATDRNLRYVDLTSDILDPSTRLVDPYVQNTLSTNHLLHHDRGAEVWSKRLNECLNEIDDPFAKWIELEAVHDTFIKAGVEHSDDLLADEKTFVKVGQVLRARYRGLNAHHMVTSDGTLDNAPLSKDLRLIHIHHWKVKPPRLS